MDSIQMMGHVDAKDSHTLTERRLLGRLPDLAASLGTLAAELLTGAWQLGSVGQVRPLGHSPRALDPKP